MHLNQTLTRWDLGETVIRKMTRLANDFGAVNLSQGFPDYDTPAEVKEAARAAIAAGTFAALRRAVLEAYGSDDAEPVTAPGSGPPGQEEAS